MYKLTTTAIDTDDLSIGIYRDLGRSQRKLANNKTQKGKVLLRIMLVDIFGFVEHQEKAIFGLGYKVTLTRNIRNSVLNKDNAISNAKIKSDAIEWYVPHYTPSISNQKILSK